MLTQYSMNSETAKQMRRRCGAYLKGLRLDAGLTQAQIANALGYQYYTMISQIEAGKARVPPEDYDKWSTLLKVDMKEFVKTILSYMDPFTYHALFGGENPILTVQREANARHKKSESPDAGSHPQVESRNSDARKVIDRIR